MLVVISGFVAGLGELMSVEVAWSSIRRQGREQGHVQLLLRAKGDPVRLAQVLWRTAEEVTVPGEQDSLANGGYRILVGPVLIVDHDAVTPAEATQWYLDLAARLEEQGITGKLTALPRTPPPPWVLDVPTEPSPRTHLLYSIDAASDKRWIAPEVRRQIAVDVSCWLQTSRGHGYLETHGPAFLVDPSFDMTDIVDATMGELGFCHVLAGSSERVRVKIAILQRTPAMGVSIWEPGLEWPEMINQLRQPLLWHPHLLDYGFVRTTTSIWSLTKGTDYPLPYGNSSAKPFVWERQYQALNDRIAYNSVVVPDTHGIQLLTGAHLANAHDLSHWTITEVAPDRYLVEADDLAAWYAQPHPDQATLVQARADFGDMIITANNIDQYPLLQQHLL
jgi:hypothetical protein